jgi:predicted transcriptional regulator
VADAASTLTIHVSETALARLNALAARRELSPDDLIGEALDAYLGLQDWHATAVAEALAAADARERTIEHEKMVAWLKSWGTDDELPPPP